MQWDCSVNGGFNKGAKTWLPLHPDCQKINVETELAKEKSVLRYFKELLHLRKESDVLRRGTFRDLTGEAKNYFMYEREHEGKKLLVVCNFEKESVIEIPENAQRILGNYPEHNDSKFAPYESAIYTI